MCRKCFKSSQQPYQTQFKCSYIILVQVERGGGEEPMPSEIDKRETVKGRERVSDKNKNRQREIVRESLREKER